MKCSDTANESLCFWMEIFTRVKQVSETLSRWAVRCRNAMGVGGGLEDVYRIKVNDTAETVAMKANVTNK